MNKDAFILLYLFCSVFKVRIWSL